MFDTYSHRQKDLGRAIEELRALGRLWNTAVMPVCPEGANIGVLFIPGIGAEDKTTAKTRQFFAKFGYQAFATDYDGRMTFTPQCLRVLEGNVAKVAKYLRPGGHLFLVGHSAGSVIARGISKKLPGQISAVFSLGGVYRTDLGNISTDVSRNAAENYFQGIATTEDFDHYFDSLDDVGNTPNVSISTNADDFVPDGVSISENPDVKNVMVMQSNGSLLGKDKPNTGPSHMGLIYNVPAMKVIAEEISAIGSSAAEPLCTSLD